MKTRIAVAAVLTVVVSVVSLLGVVLWYINSGRKNPSPKQWQLDPSSHRCVQTGGSFASEQLCLASTFSWNGLKCAPTDPAASHGDMFSSEMECMGQPAVRANNRCTPGGVAGSQTLSQCLESSWYRKDSTTCARGAPSTETQVYGTEDECKGTWVLRDKKCVQSFTDDGEVSLERCLATKYGFDTTANKCRDAPPAAPGDDVYADADACERAHPSRAQVDQRTHRCLPAYQGKHESMDECLANAWWYQEDQGVCVQGGATSSIPSLLYESKEECTATIPKPVLSKFGLVNHGCAPKADGTFGTQADCVNASVVWNGVQCVPATTDKQYLYSSVDDCEHENAENENKTWVFADNKCSPAAGGGTYATARECRATKFYAIPGTSICEMARYGAVANHGLFSSREECERSTVSENRMFSYNSTHGRCEPSIGGTEKSYAACMDGSSAVANRPDAVMRRAGYRVFYLTNRRDTEVWVALTNSKSSSGSSDHKEVPLTDSGFVLGAGKETYLYVNDSWSGRLWARTDCEHDPGSNKLTCKTGDCAGNVFCADHSGSPPATLVEFTFDPTTDYFDLSVLDGYNVGVRITALEGESSAGAAKVRPYRLPTTTQCAMDPTLDSVAPDARTPGLNTISMPVALIDRDAHESSPQWRRLRMDSDAHAAAICSCDTPNGEGCVSEKCKYGCSPINTRVCADPNNCDPLCNGTDGAQPETHRTCDGAAHKWERGGRCYVERWPSTALGLTFPDMMRSQCGTLAYTWQFDDAAALRTVHHNGTAVDAPDYWIEFLPSATSWDIELQHNMSNGNRVWAYDPSSFMCRDIHDTSVYWKNTEPPKTGESQLDCLGRAPTTADVLDNGIRYACDWDSGFLKKDGSGGKTMAEALPTCYKKRMRCDENGRPTEVWDPLEERDTLTPTEARFACGTLSANKRYKCNLHTARCEEDVNGVSMYECARQCAPTRPDSCIRDATDADDPSVITNYGSYVVTLPEVEGDNTKFCTLYPPCIGNKTTGDGYCQLDMTKEPCVDPADSSKPCPRCQTNKRCVLPSHTFPDGTHCYDEINKTMRPDVPCCNGCL